MSVISHPSKIAWIAKTPGIDSMTISSGENLSTDLHSLTQWPSLNASNKIPSKQSREDENLKVSYMTATMSTHQHGNAIIPPMVQDDEKRRFPWAARMNPSTRNLYRATSPTYMEDGTPKVLIPSHVLLKGLENQKEFVLGHFYRCSTPPGGLIHAVVNRIWGKKCRIFIRKLGDSSYLFHIPDKSTRSWVLQRGLWHVDECLMFVAPWSPTSTLSMPAISTVPVWVTLKNIPNQLYSISGISHIASGLGAPMATYKPRLDPTLMGEAKIMVEVELDKPFPQRIAAADNKGSISMIDVEYSWIPTKCRRCGHLGHKESRCLQHCTMPQANTKVVTETACLSTSEIAPVFVSNIDAAIDVVSVPFIEATTVTTNIPTREESVIEDISGSTTLEVPLQDSESATVVEFLTTTSKSHEVVSATEMTPPLALVLSNVDPPTDPTTQEAIMETRFPTLDAQAVQVSSNLPQLDIQNTGVLVVDGHVSSNISSLPPLDDTSLHSEIMLRENGVLSTPESSDTDVDLVTTSSQRILRERPVQPTLRYNEDEWISVTTCRRSKRSRGGRRGRFD